MENAVTIWFMETVQIINETGKLPVYQQMIIVEHIIRSIRHTEQDRTLEMAAERLYEINKAQEGILKILGI